MFNPNTSEKPLPNIHKTVNPDEPFENFNEWINYIHREVSKKHYIVVIDNEKT